jgi:hypothetical protein
LKPEDFTSRESLHVRSTQVLIIKSLTKWLAGGLHVSTFGQGLVV